VIIIIEVAQGESSVEPFFFLLYFYPDFPILRSRVRMEAGFSLFLKGGRARSPQRN